MPSRTFSLHSLEADPQSAFPVEVISVGTEVRADDTYRWDNRRHSRPGSHIFQYTRSGSGWFASGTGAGRTVDAVGPGQLFLASHDQPFEYFYRGTEPWEFLWITLRGEFTERAARELRQPRPVLTLPPESPPAALLGQLADRLDGPLVGDRYSLAVLAYDFLVQLLKIHREGEEDPFRREVKDHLLRHLAEADVASLARHFGYSPKYFIALFRTKLGQTPNRYLLDQKVRYACLLLTGTRKPIKQIAAEVGFADENYFGKAFRRTLGSSPGTYRDRHRGEVTVDNIVLL
jgi:AraC-like DNA-binding protein